MAQRLAFQFERVRRSDAVFAFERAPNRVGACAGTVEHVADLVLAVLREREHRRRADLEQREHQRDEARHVRELHDDARAETDAALMQVRREVVHSLLHLGVRQAMLHAIDVAAHERDGIARSCHPLIEKFAKRPAMP